uniref:Transmembrane protein 192 n=1 Tax=Cacopsylla melanoneura TaxID=428564 RepID=A0A8D9BZK2_9HEMI
MSEELLSWVVHNPSTFKPLKVFPLIVFYSIYIMMYLGLSMFSFIIPDIEVKCDIYFVMIYCNVTTWILTALTQDYFRRKHYYLKLRGYVTFYKEVQPFVILMFFVASLGNILMIALLATFLIINRNKLLTCGTEDFLSSPANQLSALILIQCLVILYLMFKYARKVHKFNKMQPPSEMSEQEMPGMYIGCRPSEQEIDDLITKQADLIDYYREINKKLMEKLSIRRDPPSVPSVTAPCHQIFSVPLRLGEVIESSWSCLYQRLQNNSISK